MRWRRRRERGFVLPVEVHVEKMVVGVNSVMVKADVFSVTTLEVT